MKSNSPRLLIVLACFTFLVSGLFNGGIGPVLGELSLQSGDTLAAVGGVITFLFIGALIAQVITGPVADRLGLKAVLMAAFILLAAGLVGLSLATSLATLFFFFFVAGLGQGCMNLGVNLVVANAATQKNTSSLNLLHFFFGLGAFISPALVSLMLSARLPGVAVHLITAGLFGLILLLYALFYQDTPRTNSPTNTSPITKTRLYQSPLIWTLGVLLLVYVGAEYGMGSWSTTLMKVAAGMSTEKGALVTSAYWGCFTIGRLAGAFFSRKLSNRALLLVSILSALLGFTAFTLLLSQTTAMIVALLWTALSLGPVFPTTVAFATQAFPQDQGKAFGLVGAMSSVGGLSIPLMDGLFLENNSLHGFAIFNIVTLLAMVGCYLLARHLTHKPQSQT